MEAVVNRMKSKIFAVFCFVVTGVYYISFGKDICLTMARKAESMPSVVRFLFPSKLYRSAMCVWWMRSAGWACLAIAAFILFKALRANP